jgi:hypothetical protein
MNYSRTTSAHLDQSEEEILTYTASDEALEASADAECQATGPYTVLHYGCDA